MPRFLRSGPVLSLLLALVPVSFDLGCGGQKQNVTPPAPGSFILMVSPATIALAPGSTQQFQVRWLPTDGFDHEVNITFTGLPQGVTLSPATVALTRAEAPVTITATASADIDPGTVPVICTGAWGSISDTKTIQFVLSVGSFTLSATPASILLGPGTSRDFQVQRVPSGGFNKPVNVAFAGVPPGVTLSPATFSLVNNDPVTVTATASANIGTVAVPITCTGTYGSLTDTRTIQFTISAIGSFTLSATPASFHLSPGTSQTFQVLRVPSDGFNKPITVTFAGVPEGITLSPASFSLVDDNPFTVTASAAANIQATNTPIACTGSYLTLKDTKAIQVLWDLPVMTITTTNAAPILDKVTYVPGHISLDAGGAYAYETDFKIRGRGNSTWDLAPKKPYKVKLPKGQGTPFGMPVHTDWALLANYFDKSLMRNVVAMELSQRLNMPYTPRSAYTDVILNGSHDGTYLLMESIKVDPNRVKIPAMSATDIAGDALTGGYLMEIDERFGQAWLWPGTKRTAHGIAVGLQDPEVPTVEQQAYIVDYVQQAEDAIFRAATSNDYEQFLDVDTFINWYLVNEVYANVDAGGFSSCWMYKDRGGKLCMGPVWDFDLGAGNMDYASCQYPTGWWVRTQSAWFSQLFQNATFAAKVKARWNVVKATQLDTIFEFIDQNALILDQSQQKNFARWPILGVNVWVNPVPVPTTYAGELDYLKTWLTQRIAWMDRQYNP